MSRRIIVHSLGDARAALAAAAALGVAIELQSAPGAGAYAGAPWFQALAAAAAASHPAAAMIAILDCGDEPGAVLAALAQGIKHLRYGGAGPALERLAALAQAAGATLESGPAPAALDLLGKRDPEAACRAFLATRAAAD